MVILWGLIFAVWTVAFLTLRRTQRIARIVPLDNLPVVFLLILALYTTLPPLFWLMQGGEYVSNLSGRLFYLQPTLEEQTYLTFLGLMIAIGVAGSQLVLPRHYNRSTLFNEKVIPKKIVIVCFAIIGIKILIITMLQVTGTIRAGESYIDNYLVIQELPLYVRQFVKILGGLAFFSKLVILVWLFQRWRRYKWWVYGFIIIAILTFDPEGGRASLFITLFACLILWNRYVKRITLSQLLMLGLTGVIAFTALGIYRGLVNTGFTGLSLSNMSFGEFNVLWANALELYREKLSNTQNFPWTLYFSELYGPIPSNLLPIEKMSYSQWYLNQYYEQYKQQGGGLMFGVLAQVVVGFGWVEALIRGFLVGLFLGAVNYYLSKCSKWWHYPALLYCAVFSFQSVRDSSFSLISPLVQTVVVGVITISLVAGILFQGGRPIPGNAINKLQ